METATTTKLSDDIRLAKDEDRYVFDIGGRTYGPYDTKSEAEDDRKWLRKFYRENPDQPSTPSPNQDNRSTDVGAEAKEKVSEETMAKTRTTTRKKAATKSGRRKAGGTKKKASPKKKAAPKKKAVTASTSKKPAADKKPKKVTAILEGPHG